MDQQQTTRFGTAEGWDMVVGKVSAKRGRNDSRKIGFVRYMRGRCVMQ